MDRRHQDRYGQGPVARALFASAAALVVALGFSASAGAALIVSTGPDNKGTDNVISGPSCAAHVDEGNPVQGCLNQDRNRLVNISSGNETGLHYASGGQATVRGGTEALPDLFGDLYIEFADLGLINKLVLNIDIEGSTGFVQFSDLENTTSALFPLGNGSNFFTIEGGEFAAIDFQTFFELEGQLGAKDIVIDVKQIRIGGPGIEVEVPEPAPLALLGIALAGLGFARRRKRH